MKNFSIQSFSLMIMIVVVYTASLSQHQSKRARLKRSHDGCNNTNLDDFKRLIHDEAKRIVRNVTDQEMIPWTTGHVTCVKHFSCLAEKALNQSTNHKILHKLIHLLHQYNQCHNQTKCRLEEDSKCTLHKVLHNIEKCFES